MRRFDQLRAFVWRSLVFALVWAVISAGDPASWVVGVPAVGAATLASLSLSRVRPDRVSLPGLIGFVAFFVVASFRAGVVVAFQALRPRPDLAPGMLRFRVTLASGTPRVMLAATLNLMPGTLTARLDDDELLVHVLDRRLPIADEVRAVEARVARVFRRT